jgi:hypothetical protein
MIYDFALHSHKSLFSDQVENLSLLGILTLANAYISFIYIIRQKDIILYSFV